MHAGRLIPKTHCTSCRALRSTVGISHFDFCVGAHGVHSVLCRNVRPCSRRTQSPTDGERNQHVTNARPDCTNVFEERSFYTERRSSALREPGRRSVAACCATATEVSSDSTPASVPAAATRLAPAEQLDDASAPAAASAVAPAFVDATFASPSGAQFWRVRPYDNSDYAAIIEVETDSFHTANPVPFLNTLTYNNFRAEVVDALRQKIKYSHPSTFQLLVAEELPSSPHQQEESSSAQDRGGDSSSSGSSSSGRHGGALVGSVEVSLMQEREVLRALPQPPQPQPLPRSLGSRAATAAGSGDYAYVSSMCVRITSRRRGVAQALMAAAEAQARLWRQPRLALHVYKDNTPAVELYRRCGMRVLAEDPGWKAMLGGRVRLLMYKELTLAGEDGQEKSGSEVEQPGEGAGEAAGRGV